MNNHKIIIIGIVLMMILAAFFWLDIRLHQPQVCKDEITIVSSFGFIYASVPMKDVKSYICDEGTIVEPLRCPYCSFWVKKGRCAVLMEVCR